MRRLLLVLLPSLSFAAEPPWCVEEEGPRICCPALPIARVGESEYVIDLVWARQSDAFAASTGCGTVSKQPPSWAPLLRFVRGGFTLARITERSGYFHLGIREGDVVRAVQGIPIEASDVWLEAFRDSENLRLFVVDLERDGVPLRFWYRLVEGCHDEGKRHP